MDGWSVVLTLRPTLDITGAADGLVERGVQQRRGASRTLAVRMRGGASQDNV